MDDQLNPRPRVDQDKATSRLLDPPTDNSQAPADHNNEKKGNYTDHPSDHTGYDSIDISASHENGNAPIDGRNTSSTAVLWKGLPRYLLTSELLSIILSLCFLALGASLASLEGKPESTWSARVMQASRIAPSIWPIVFSGVLGNAMRALADYKVERGVSLLGLEQLLGSLTMASSAITIFRWSIFRVSSFAIILLWAFNPLGSQASFRGAYLRSNTGTAHGNITYYSPTLSVQLGLSPFAGGSTPAIRAFYSTALYDYVSRTQYVDPLNNVTKGVVTMMGGEKTVAVQAAMDTWGNVRIPALQYLSDYNPDHPHRWIETPWNEMILNYSSLLGDRVDGVDRKSIGNTTFTVVSSSQHHSCIPWFQLSNQASTAPNGTKTNSSEADIWFLYNTGKDYASHAVPSYSRRNTLARPFVVTHAKVPNSLGRYLPQIIFASSYNNSTRLSVTACTARTMYVEAKVTCISPGDSSRANCGVHSIRETPTPPEDPSTAVLDSWTDSQYSLIDFMDSLDILQAGRDHTSNTENFLLNPLFAFTNSDGRDPNDIAHADRASGGLLSQGDGTSIGYDKTALSTIDIATFERRFSLLWNTLWKIGWARKSVEGGGWGDSINDANMSTVASVEHAASNVTFPLPAVYAIDRAWMGVYFVSVAVMFLAACFSLVVRSLCHAPQVLGYASSLVRDSRYFEDVTGMYRNSAEDGFEKSRRLGRMRVMLADVSGGTETGKIAFAPVSRGMVTRVEKGRWYE